MTRAILVAGTWGWRGIIPIGAWWAPSSPFVKALTGLGIDVVGTRAGERPFVWSTDLDGLVGERNHYAWKAGAAGFYEYVSPSLCPSARVTPLDTLVIAHSHGLQPVLYAASEGLKIDRLVSVCSPIRYDMIPVMQAARPNIRRWRHLYSDWSDPIQIGGEDGCAVREAALADANVMIPGVGHTGLLEDPAQFSKWQYFCID